MTRTRLYVQPHEVERLIVTCEQCQNALAIPLSSDKQIPSRCPQCGAFWYHDGPHQPALEDHLLMYLRMVAATYKDEHGEQKERPIRLELELTPPRST